MEIRQLLERLGHDNLISPAWYARIAEWRAWYAGKSAWHHYTIYNGESTLRCERKTLGMAKKVAEDKADLLLNEKVSISVPDERKQEFLDEVLDRNNFWVRGNQLVELTNALGTGAFVEYIDGDKIWIDYVPANCIWPLRWENGEIIECAFASHLSDDRTYIQRHLLYGTNGELLDGGRYVVFNDLYDENGKRMPLPEGVLDEWATKSERPLYQIITPNVCNNIDISNPMGISIYANAIDALKVVDTIYDSLYNEFNLGKKRVFVKTDVVKIDTKTGEPIPVFDKNDTVFYALPGEDSDKLVTESNMALRVNEHVLALQTALDVLSEKCGLGKGYYKFDADDVRTATEVISHNSKLFRRVKKDEIILEKALKDMARIILFLGGESDIDVSVSFDDSIIEDTNAIANRAMLERNSGIIDDVTYFMLTRDLDEEAAQQLVEKISARKPVVTAPDMF